MLAGVDRLWHAFWPQFYRLLRWFDPFLRRWLSHFTLGNTVELTVIGRRSGRSRTVFLGLLAVGERSYLGHPDLPCAWTLNLEAAGEGGISHPTRGTATFRAVLLPAGEERERVIRATFHQHPFPGNVLYWLARRHIRSVGRFYRLEELPVAEQARARDIRPYP
jgi:hypothetical protein